MSGALPYHIEQLRALCDEHPVGRKVVFVASRQIGYNLGNALAAYGRSWVNLYLTTPADWAERLVGPRLKAEGWRPLVQDGDFFLVQSLVREIRWPQGYLLENGFAGNGVAKAFLATIRALRQAGVDVHELRQTRFRNAEILAPVYRAYCDWMIQHQFYDHTNLLRESAEVARTQENAVVAVFDEVSLSRPAYEFVDAISGGDLVRIGRDAYSSTPPQHCTRRRFPDAPLPAAVRGSVHPSAGLLGSDGSTIDARIELREAIGVENEVKGTLRELIKSEIPLDAVEIAYTTEVPYLSLLVDTADRYNLPLTSAAGVPVTCTSVGQSLVGFYSWMAAGYDPSALVTLLRSRLLETKATHKIAPEEVGALLEEARVGRGLQTYMRALDRLEDRVARPLKQGEVGSEGSFRRERVRRAKRVVEDLCALCPDGGSISLSGLCETGVQFLETFSPLRRTDRDATAGESLRDRLEELATGASVSGQVSELSSVLVELLGDHKIEASVVKPGHLYAVPLSRAGYSGRDRLVVVGMAETTFPGVALEDPMLLDEERREVSGELVIERARTSDAVWELERALGMTPGTVVLVSNRRTTADGRETYPSAVFQELATQLGLDRTPIYGSVPETETALDESELILSIKDSQDIRNQLEDMRPWLANGLEAQRQRAEAGIGQYDGRLCVRTPELRPGADGPISASRLEDLSACPYRYFLKYVLDVRPPDVPEETPGRWLTPLEFGALLHRVLRDFMSTLSARDEKLDAEKHKPLLDDVLHRHVEQARSYVPVIHEAGFRADLSRLQRAVRIFLREETRRDVSPVGFEVSFGLGETGGLNRPDPIEIKLSEEVQIAMKGSIDRVDRAVDGYEVWDYKTGSTYDYDEYDLLTGGRRLQWALYAYALEQLIADVDDSGNVARSGYFFTSDREPGLRLAQSPPPRDEVARRLQPLFDLTAEGGFPHVQKSQACTFCDYKAVCASERIGERDYVEIENAGEGDRLFFDLLDRWMST